ncbi:TIGR03084 family metal-binding protein [Mycolicibacterium gilvum]|uniref:Wyosine base formation n=1 Tax=Mycolicibacterium gilvum TaxID=1804 RepID=A0A378SKP7_9MYCO|nr:TIGR03084 family metal-binding protein [Mycolicibacterium gilvum]MCV7054320.1 TIGR03084 family protein [Mycolicibacterium gilvum]STZ42728.1 wyosine base formation [Mycolicibacterium gilvum]
MDHDGYKQLLDDLKAESDQLTDCLRTLSFEQWGHDTPAVGWGIQDQVTHLAFFDDATAMALQRPDEFRSFADALMADGMDFPDRIAENHRILSPESIFNWFRDSRADLLDVLSAHEPKDRMPWFGPDMSAASAATARLMETWAHGQDIYDALGVEHPPSPGLRSIAHLGVATFAFTHRLHGLDVPTEDVYVALDAPDGGLWTWGTVDSPEKVRGSAEEFVLVVTQRRHWTETDLVAEGGIASRWLDVAQAFAGAPSRRPPKVTP